MNIGRGRDIPYQKIDGCMNYREFYLAPERGGANVPIWLFHPIWFPSDLV